MRPHSEKSEGLRCSLSLSAFFLIAPERGGKHSGLSFIHSFFLRQRQLLLLLLVNTAPSGGRISARREIQKCRSVIFPSNGNLATLKMPWLTKLPLSVVYGLEEIFLRLLAAIFTLIVAWITKRWYRSNVFWNWMINLCMLECMVPLVLMQMDTPIFSTLDPRLVAGLVQLGVSISSVLQGQQRRF